MQPFFRLVGMASFAAAAFVVFAISFLVIWAEFDLPEHARIESQSRIFLDRDAEVSIIRDRISHGRREVVLMEPWGFEHIAGDQYMWIPVSPRFVSDFATIPGSIQWLIQPFGRHAEAALLHDWLYSVGGLDRRDADILFFVALRRSGVSPIYARMMYAAVRLFAGENYGKRELWEDSFYEPLTRVSLPDYCLPARPKMPKVEGTIKDGALILSESRWLNFEVRPDGRLTVFEREWAEVFSQDMCADFLYTRFMDQYAPFVAFEGDESERMMAKTALFIDEMQTRLSTPSDEIERSLLNYACQSMAPRLSAPGERIDASQALSGPLSDCNGQPAELPAAATAKGTVWRVVGQRGFAPQLLAADARSTPADQDL